MKYSFLKIKALVWYLRCLWDAGGTLNLSDGLI